MNNAHKYVATIKHEGFTPTRLHYFVLTLAQAPYLIKTNRGTVIARPIGNFTHVVFANNPLHKYITDCKEANTPITIKGEILERPTGFTYVPHAKVNGHLQPLMSNKLDITNGTYKKEPVKLNTIRIFISDDKREKMENIVANEINRIKKFSI
jgi:hypothetical protein